MTYKIVYMHYGSKIMKFREIMFATLLLLTIITIGAVSASEDIAGDNVTAIEPTGEQTVQAVDEIKQTDEVIVQTDNDEILSEKDDGTFTALQNKIDATEEGSIITLENDYKYDDYFNKTNRITISKSLTIDGQGHTIDANSQSGIFYLTGNSIVLKNITFTNSYLDEYDGAIINEGGNCTINSCIFKNCFSKDSGVIDNGYACICTLNSCTFNNCSAWYYGAAIYNGGICTVNSCTFNDCLGYDAIYNHAGDCYINFCNFNRCGDSAIENSGSDGTTANCIIDSCAFNDCWSKDIYGDGGAIYNTKGVNCIINSCNFNNCSAGDDGGAIKNDNAKCNINSCTFNNCFAGEEGGAIYNYGEVDCIITFSNFNNCSAGEEGGAIYYYDGFDSDGVVRTIKSCTFNNCTAGEGGAIYNSAYSNRGYNDNWNLDLKSCTFNNCVAADGSAIMNYDAMCTIESCTFNKCSAKNAGTIYNNDVKCIIDSSTFNNCSAKDGGAIYNIGGKCSIYSDTFNKCYSSDKGASIYILGDYIITGCKFSGFCEDELYPIDVATTDCIFLLKTSISASNVATVYNGGKYLMITLKDNEGKAVRGVGLSVSLGGKTDTPTTNKNGQVKVSTNGLAPVKTYKATITFKGNSKYDKSTTTAKVVVKKANPKLTAAKKTFKRTVKVKNYAVVLKTNQNKALKSAWVYLKVNKKTYKVKTNSRGQAIFKINNLAKKGTFNAIVKFAGNKYYNAKTVNTKITVK